MPDIPEPTPEPSPRRGRLRDLQSAGLVSTVGISLVLCSAIGAGLGYLVDQRWGSTPWGVAVGFLFGTAAGFVELFRVVSKANRDE